MNERNYDESILTLVTAQKVTNEHLDSIDETLDALDRTLRGDYQNERDGIVERLKHVETLARKLESVVFQSSEGQKGLLYKVDAIISGKMDAVERRKSRASVIIAIITSAALVITNLDRLGEFWVKTFVREPPVKHVKKVRVRRVIDYSEPSPPSE